MWTDNFKWVVINSLKYPFQRFSEIKELFIATAIVSALLSTVSVPLHIAPDQAHQDVFATLALIAVSILSMLILLPLSVAVIRNVVLQEPAHIGQISQIFKKRPILYLVALIKASLASLFLAVVGFAVVFLLFYGVGYSSPKFEFSRPVQLGTSAVLATLLYLYLVLRFSFAPVHAALDKGTRLTDAWALTRGYFGLIVASLIVVTLVVIAIFFLSVLIIGGILFPFFYWYAESGPYLIGFFYGLLYPFLMLFELAAMGNLYLVMHPKNDA